MKILLMGPIGSGKGTQGELLSTYLGLPLLSIGQVLRKLDPAHPWYKEINRYMVEGKPAPQNKVAVLFRQVLSRSAYSKGYIMDGWGRTEIDLHHYNPGYDKVVLIDVSPAVSISRISTRRTCKSCGAVYNVVSMPSAVEGVCDKCGGVLKQRDDDTEQAILKRLETYKTETTKVVERFRSEGILVVVNGEGSPEEVFEEIKKHFQ